MIKRLPNGIAVIERDTHLGKWVQESGQLFSEATRADFAPFIKPGDHVIDVGACIGNYTALFLELVGPSGTVSAIEPNPEPFQCLQINCPKAHCFQIGCSDECDSCSIDNRDDNIGAAFLIPCHFGGIKCHTLDCLFPTEMPSLLKIDVEGMECEVLEGARKLLERSKPVLFIEYNARTLPRSNKTIADLRALLKSLGYDDKLPDSVNSEMQRDAFVCHS